jgi:hypothetical protein
MAKETTATLYLGADHTYPFTILNQAETLAVDISGWALSWMVKRRKSDADAAAVLTKTTVSGIVISGTYNATITTNTQVATVTVADTDTDAIAEGLYHYELKRTDAGLETPLAFGTLTLKRGVHRT